MKTKIVYVLTSNEKDLLLEQLLLSLYSLRHYNPSSEVYLVVDQDTFSTIKGPRNAVREYLTDVIAIKTPEEYNNMLRSRWLKTSLREHIKGDYLFIDSDTIITDSLEECDNWNFDIASVIDRHIPVDKAHQYYDLIIDNAKKTGWQFEKNDAFYFNSGVMFVKDNQTTHSFFKKWHEYWIQGIEKKVYQDQPTLGRTNKEFGYLMHELNGMWNCQVLANGIKFLNNSKIVHYFNAERQSQRKSIFYLPSNKELYQEIKNSGFVLDDKIKEMIENGRCAFSLNYAVFADEQLLAIRDSFSNFVIRGYFLKNKFYKFLRGLYSIYCNAKNVYK